MEKPIFDSWTEKYDSWFDSPVGRYVKRYEADVLLELLNPQAGELILDAGCGTGIFTLYVLNRGAEVVGIDLSAPMVRKGVRRLADMPFAGVCGDMTSLPFEDNSFDRVFSMTAIEFIADASPAIAELFRVVKNGGCVVVTTLNSLSPWAEVRSVKGKEGHPLFKHITFRSPRDMRLLSRREGEIKSAIHFLKNESVHTIPQIEERGRMQKLDTGAFLAIKWTKN